jgi:hypothetical protein
MIEADMVKHYKKKPLTVRVCQFTGTEDNIEFITKWSTETPSDSPVYTPVVRYEHGIAVVTLEGTMKPKVGDYVVQGPAGEFWFVRKEIFEETYEEV